MNSRGLCLATVLAALYIAIGLVLPAGFCFGPVQSRISDALYPLIAVFGMPALIGLTLGHLIYNVYGFSIGAALGLLDIFGSIPLFLLPKFAIYKWGLKAVPLHVLFVALWVPYLVCTVVVGTLAPYWIIVLSVGIGEAFAELVIGVPLAIAVKRGVFK